VRCVFVEMIEGRSVEMGMKARFYAKGSEAG